MSVFASADVILFGIRSGLRLFGAARQTYIERTRELGLTLPLPGAKHGDTPSMARNWFIKYGATRVAASPRLLELHTKARTTVSRLGSAEAREYVEYFQLHRSERAGQTLDGLFGSEIVALNTITQWRAGKTPHPTALKRVAGTLVEVGVDFFTTGPGHARLAGRSTTAVVLRELLTALDDHGFSEDGLDGVVEKMFVAALEFLGEHADHVSDDPRLKTLVSEVARGLAADVAARLRELPEEDRLFAGERLGDTARLIFRGVLRHGAETVLEKPAWFLSVPDGGESALVTHVGTVILDALVPRGGDALLDLDALLSGKTLDAVIKGTLTVVAEHPELLGLDDGSALEELVSAVASGIAASETPIGPAILPEVARLILERTAVHLDRLWCVEDPGRHLLVTAVRTLLEQLAGPADSGGWNPRLGKTELLAVVEAVLDEVADNPALITKRIGRKPALTALIETLVTEMAKVDPARLDPATIGNILRLSVQAAAVRFDFLEKLPSPGRARAKMALGHVIDAIFSTAFDGAPARARATWFLASGTALEAVTGASLELLAEHGVDAAALDALRGALDAAAKALATRQTFSIEAFAIDLEERLDPGDET